MKKLLLSLFIITLFLSGCTDNKQTIVTSKTTVQHYYYGDYSGKEVYSFENDTLTLHEEYDSEDNLISTAEYEYEDNVTIITTQYSSENKKVIQNVDEKGNVLSNETYVNDELTYSESREYDNDGNLVSLETKDYVSAFEVSISKYVYTYQDGKLTQIDEYINDDTDPWETTICFYDDNGSLIRKETTNRASGTTDIQYVDPMVTDEVYDGDKLIKQVVTTTSAEDGSVYVEESVYTYLNEHDYTVDQQTTKTNKGGDVETLSEIKTSYSEEYKDDDLVSITCEITMTQNGETHVQKRAEEYDESSRINQVIESFDGEEVEKYVYSYE